MPRDNLSASFVLMGGAGFLAYWFYHLTGAQRMALLAKARGTDTSGPAGGLKPYMPTEVVPTNPSSGGQQDYGQPFGSAVPNSRKKYEFGY